jgi:glycosyltransferase involved in cell wall biosynthesis
MKDAAAPTMLSVVIATLNGEHTLPAVFDAYTKQAECGCRWEMLIVDNGSADNTQEVIETYASHLPLTYLQEFAPGKNVALNAAVARAAGEVLLFTDDDTVPNPNFLRRWVERLDRTPDFDLFGGPVVPRYPTSKPSWLDDPSIEMVCFARTLPSNETGPIGAGAIFGNNMLVRRRVFDRGMFDTNIGPMPGAYLMGSETEFNVRMEKLGFRAFFDASNDVEHIIEPFQFEQGWLFDRAVNFGRGRVYLERLRPPYEGPKLFGRPRYLYALYLKYWLKSRLSRDPAESFSLRWKMFEVKGRVLGYAKRRS